MLGLLIAVLATTIAGSAGTLLAVRRMLSGHQAAIAGVVRRHIIDAGDGLRSSLRSILGDDLQAARTERRLLTEAVEAHREGTARLLGDLSKDIGALRGTVRTAAGSPETPAVVPETVVPEAAASRPAARQGRSRAAAPAARPGRRPADG